MSFVKVDKTVIKGETVVHLHKTKEVKDNLNMDKVTIRDHLLEVKMVKTWKKGSSIHFAEDNMHTGWSEGQGHGCSNCGGDHHSDEYRQPDRIISVTYPVANPQQQARDNMRGARPQDGLPNELRPPNLYYDHGNVRQTFHPPAGLQTANGYIPIQGRQGDPQNFDNRRQVPPTDPGPSNS